MVLEFDFVFAKQREIQTAFDMNLMCFSIGVNGVSP